MSKSSPADSDQQILGDFKGTMAAGTDTLEVARAHEELSTTAGELAEAVQEEDRSSLRPRARARGSD